MTDAVKRGKDGKPTFRRPIGKIQASLLTPARVRSLKKPVDVTMKLVYGEEL